MDGLNGNKAKWDLGVCSGVELQPVDFFSARGRRGFGGAEVLGKAEPGIE